MNASNAAEIESVRPRSLQKGAKCAWVIPKLEMPQTVKLNTRNQNISRPDVVPKVLKLIKKNCDWRFGRWLHLSLSKAEYGQIIRSFIGKPHKYSQTYSSPNSEQPNLLKEEDQRSISNRATQYSNNKSTSFNKPTSRNHRRYLHRNQTGRNAQQHPHTKPKMPLLRHVDR